MRRIVQYPASTHYSEIKISPQWHQWLRHTRKDPPTLTEQSQDLVRQRNLKRLAAEADARWAAKPSYLDTPGRAQPLTASGVKDPRVYVESEEAEVGTEARNAISRTLEDRIRDTDANLGNRVAREHGSRIVEESGAGASREVPTKKGESRLKDKKEQLDPWKHARGGPSEEWQPQAWGGTVAPRKGL
jgi:NADH dehydrogenase [ubiquinone] 1 alpha subcomplex assembly factor 2